VESPPEGLGNVGGKNPCAMQSSGFLHELIAGMALCETVRGRYRVLRYSAPSQGTVGGVAGITLVYPLDTAKTRFVYVCLLTFRSVHQ
jgi:hypothetical protein